MIPGADLLVSTSPTLRSSVPYQFNPVTGRVLLTWTDIEVTHPKPSRPTTGAQRAGLAYERKALRALSEDFPALRRKVWFGFRDEGGKNRCCQPDGFVVFEGKLLIFEIKIRHSAFAWWQLRRLYEPVLREVYRDIPIVIAEVTRSYASDIALPERALPFFSMPKFKDWVRHDGTGFGVLQLKV